MHGAGILLLTAVAGYWVLERASYQKKSDLRHAGKVLGWIVILVSLIGVVCNVWCAATCKTGYCPMPMKMKHGGYCPFTSPSSTAPAESK